MENLTLEHLVEKVSPPVLVGMDLEQFGVDRELSAEVEVVGLAGVDKGVQSQGPEQNLVEWEELVAQQAQPALDRRGESAQLELVSPY